MFKTNSLFIIMSIALLNSSITAIFADSLGNSTEWLERANTGQVTQNEIAQLTPEIISSLQPEHLLKLNPMIFSYFTKDQLSALSANAMRGFTAEAVAHLNPAAVSGFRANQLALLPIEAMSGWTGETFAALQPEALKGFTTEQMLQLKPSILTWITSEQWNYSATILGSSNTPLQVANLATVAKLEEMKQLLVSTAQKEILEPKDISSLNEVSEEFPTAARIANQAFRTAIQAAIAQMNLEALNQFGAQIEALQNKIMTVAMLAQQTINQLQAGETFLSQAVVNNMTDDELAEVLGETGLKAHAQLGIITSARAQTVSKLGIPTVNPDIFDSTGSSCPDNSTQSSISFGNSVLDLLFPKAQAAAVLGCSLVCKVGFDSYCTSCLVRQQQRCRDIYTNESSSCSGWLAFWCRIKAMVKLTNCLA
jgi:Zn-dependent protease with chaperone function